MRRLALTLACALALAVVVPPVGAQRIDPQVALGRICVSEIGLTGDPEECAAIHAVIARRAELRGMRWISMARAYSSRVFDPARSDRRRWVAHLRADGREPRGWPSVASWRALGPRWTALYDAAGAILRGELVAPCPPADHWGCRACGDELRAARAGWTEVECSLSSGERTRNAFWIVPRRGGEG